MAEITYIKGVRTRFQNSLKEKINNATTLITDDRELELDVRLENINSCIEKVTYYKEKLELQSEKLALSQENTEEIESILDEDYRLCSDAVDICFELEKLYKKLIHEKEKEEKEGIITGETDTHKLLELQSDMKDILKSQLEQQKLNVKKETDRMSTTKLPKIELITFSGERTKWIEFWDSFQSAVDSNRYLSAVEKFNYLKSKLSGEARRAIAGLALSGDNYRTACELLQKRFGNKQDIIDSHYSRLVSLKAASNNEKSLRNLVDSAEKQIRSLEVLDQNPDQEILVSIIKSKIPKDVLVQIQLHNGMEKPWTVQSLCERLNDYITANERATKDTSGGDTKRDAQRYSGQNRHFNKSSAGALVAGERYNEKYKKKCRYCENNHFSDQCQKYLTIEDRKRRLGKGCFKCLKDHYGKDCSSRNRCFHCKKENVHHSSLCPQKFPRTKSKTENANLSDESQEWNENKIENAYPESHETGMLSLNETVLMQTAVTDIKNSLNGKGEKVRILLDCGSHRTYISQELANRLGLKSDNEQEIQVITFGSKTPKVVKTKTTSVQMRKKDGKFMTLSANIVPNITGNISRNMIHISSQEQYDRLTKSLDMADSLPTRDENEKLDLLIGNDYYLDIINSDKIEIQPGLYLLSSCLGWIITGRTKVDAESDTNSIQNDVEMLILSHSRSETGLYSDIDDVVPTKHHIEDLWTLDAIGVNNHDESTDDQIAMRKFRETVKFENGRYSVKWPWKDESPDLPSNRELALNRLKSTVSRMKNKPDLMEKYNNVIQDQLKKNVIEKIEIETTTGEIKHYLPHHAVLTPNKETTKLRVVYDASAKTKACKSLNECLYRGTVMIHDLCGMLLRFRLHNVGIVADIEKAFLQVGLQEEDRDATRFFWLKDWEKGLTPENIQEYRFTRIPFGIISSPFLLGATIEYHLDAYENEIATKLKNDIYVDNLITGSATEEDAIELYESSKFMFNEASMNLREWISNSENVNRQIPTEDKLQSKNVKVLGHKWNVEDDTLSVNQSNVLKTDLNVTKRNILKQVASIFDPLGLFAPVTLQGKALIQKLWTKKLDWDENVPQEDSLEWQKIESELRKIDLVKINRCIAMKIQGTDIKSYLVCFCDASKKSFAASIYLVQITDNARKSNLIFAKTRLAPTKKISIPRLELMAVVIGVRCLKFVKKELNMKFSDLYLFTDSQCVLKWIESEKSLSVFVKNRVNEIRCHDDIKFGFVSSRENPSDISSRGSSIEKLQGNELWWHGPNWILDVENYMKSENDERNDENKQVEHDFNAELKKGKGEVLLATQEKQVTEEHKPPFEIEIEKFSSVSKMLRVTCYVLRFIKNLKRSSNCEKGPLKSDELEQSEKMWIKYVQRKYYKDVYDAIVNEKSHNLKTQLGIFLDDSGILRCKGRMENISLSYSARNPILLPKRDRFTHLIVEREHRKLLHSGVSQTLCAIRHLYWIPSGRSVVKSVLKQCIICRKVEGGAYKMPLMAPFPTSRVTEATAFERTGLDYLGPLHIKTAEEPKKVWVCLFTCLVTRAVHLEIINNMTTEEFLLALRRFIAQRGSPIEILSDNAKQFKLAKDVLDIIWQKTIRNDDVQTYVANVGIKWKYIVERAAWFGGFYERLVGLIKRSLRKTLGHKFLTDFQLQTVIKEVESVINSRPLVYVDSDINSSFALTPGHFITLNPKTGIYCTENDQNDPDYDPYESSAKKLLKIWNKGQKLLQQFWKLWLNEYLLSLRERTQTKLNAHRVQSPYAANVGDVVLVKDELPRGTWKLGTISEFIVSHDGKYRSAKVKLATGNVINRPLNHLYPIEVARDKIPDKPMQQNSADDNMSDTEQKRTRLAAKKSREKTLKLINDGDV